jgi:hypothetical protein
MTNVARHKEGKQMNEGLGLGGKSRGTESQTAENEASCNAEKMEMMVARQGGAHKVQQEMV